MWLVVIRWFIDLTGITKEFEFVEKVQFWSQYCYNEAWRVGVYLTYRYRIVVIFCRVRMSAHVVKNHWFEIYLICRHGHMLRLKTSFSHSLSLSLSLSLCLSLTHTHTHTHTYAACIYSCIHVANFYGKSMKCWKESTFVSSWSVRRRCENRVI
jgi:hypothetical protein